MIKISLIFIISILLNGCFFIAQLQEKLYEDCYVSTDYIKGLSEQEYQLLAKKCGWYIKKP